MQSTGSVWQVFGTRKCPETRKAQRFFKERGVRIQEVELTERGMSPGELKSVAAQSGWVALLDRTGERFLARGLAHSLLSDKDIERLLLEDPRLLVTPVVRCGKRSSIGFQPELWQTWLKG
jgi:arsenate reductase